MIAQFTLYHNLSQTWIWSCAKALGLDDRKSVNIINRDPIASRNRSFHKASLMVSTLRNFTPLALILFLMVSAYTFLHFHPPSWDNLKHFHLVLQSFSSEHHFLTPLLFLIVYILYAILSLPGIFALSLIAGYLFKQPFSTLYVTSAATVGASLLFLAARTAFGQLFYSKAGKFTMRMEKEFRENAANYLLFLRLIPLFPFWIVNVAGAYFNVPLTTFAWTTLIGMIPSVFVYTQAGRGLAILLESQQPMTAASLFNPQLSLALAGLAIFSLIPLILKKKFK